MREEGLEAEGDTETSAFAVDGDFARLHTQTLSLREASG